MDLSPVLSRPPLVEDAMEDVLVDDVRSGHCDVGSRSGPSRRDEASGVRVVISEEQALLLLFPRERRDQACHEPRGRLFQNTRRSALHVAIDGAGRRAGR